MNKEVFQIILPSGTVVTQSVDYSRLTVAADFPGCSVMNFSRRPADEDFKFYKEWSLGICTHVAAKKGMRILWACEKGGGNPESEIWCIESDGSRKRVNSLGDKNE
jgi:hypothetical protein